MTAININARFPNSNRPKVYLAGPDVFKPNATEVFNELRTYCDELGLEALIPLDTEVPEDLLASKPLEAAHFIYEANIRLLRCADAVIANLTPFRGTEPDSGTVFEVGFAQALGLHVVAYGVPKAPYAKQVEETLSTTYRDRGGNLIDSPGGLYVEDFGLPMNLMLACSTPIAPDAKAALRMLLDRL